MRTSNPLFIAYLKSGKQYIGNNDYLDPKWKDIIGEVDKVFFRLPDGNFFVMHSYKKYIYLVEGTQDLTGQNRGKLRVEYLYFMGLRNGIVDSYRITMFDKRKDRYKIGDITKRQYKWEEMKNKYIGWK